MNMTVTHKYLFLLSVVLYCNVVGAMTINNQDINKVVKPGQYLSYENLTANNIAFRAENGNLTIGGMRVDDVQNIYNRFVEFNNTPHGTMRMKVLTTAGNSQFLNGQHISSDDELTIDARSTFAIAEAVLKSKKVNIITDSISCGTCFVDSDELVIETRSAAALYAVIRFTRDKNNQNPMVLSGNMNFTPGDTNGVFVVVGAKYMTVDFHPDVFK